VGGSRGAGVALSPHQTNSVEIGGWGPGLSPGGATSNGQLNFWAFHQCRHCQNFRETYFLFIRTICYIVAASLLLIALVYGNNLSVTDLDVFKIQFRLISVFLNLLDFIIKKVLGYIKITGIIFCLVPGLRFHFLMFLKWKPSEFVIY